MRFEYHHPAADGRGAVHGRLRRIHQQRYPAVQGPVGADVQDRRGVRPVSGDYALIGYTIARLFARQIQAFDHWIAFGLLVFIGGKMLWEVLRGGEDDAPRGDPCGWMNLLVMAVATSIDAMAVGVSLAVMPHTGMLSGDYGYLLCCAVIAAVTFVICAVGVKIGCKTGDMFGRKAEIAGGIVLIGIGVKILLEHLMGG